MNKQSTPSTGSAPFEGKGRIPFPAYRGNETYIFISYAHADAQMIYKEITKFHQQGYHVWYDEGISPGNEWPDDVAEALAKCALFVVFFTQKSADSRNVQNEVNFAINKKIPFLAIHLEPTILPPGIELRIGTTQAILKYNMSEEEYDYKYTTAFERLGLKCDNDPLTYDEGVINGVKWATRNVDAPGAFAAKPEDVGMLYQWNRKKAWPATGEVTGWDSSTPTGDTWEKANDPSPSGWRVPTLDEIKTLLDTDKVSREQTTTNGVMGTKFTDRTTGNSIFLPASGARYNDDGYDGGGDGAHYFYGELSLYWSSTANNSDCAYALSLPTSRSWGSHLRTCGFSIRSVAE